MSHHVTPYQPTHSTHSTHPPLPSQPPLTQVEAVAKYQEQLQRQHQLMDNIQKSRNELLSEVGLFLILLPTTTLQTHMCFHLKGFHLHIYLFHSLTYTPLLATSVLLPLSLTFPPCTFIHSFILSTGASASQSSKRSR